MTQPDLPAASPEGSAGLTGTMNCPVCGVAEPHNHDAVTVGMAIGAGADLRVIPPVLIAHGRPHSVEKLQRILHRAAMDLFRRGLDDHRVDVGHQVYSEGLDLHDLSDRLPSLIDASTELAKARGAIEGGGISPPDADGVRVICIGYHPETEEYEWVEVVPRAQLTEARSAQKVAEEKLYEARLIGFSLVLECKPDKVLGEIKAEAKAWLDNQLRSSRDQSIAAIEALPWGKWCFNLDVGNLDEIKNAVRSILQGD